jgi:hypothetical protein
VIINDPSVPSQQQESVTFVRFEMKLKFTVIKSRERVILMNC